MSEDKAADEHRNSSKNGIEDVECAHCPYTNEVEEGAFDTKIGEGLMQALEDPVAARIAASCPA